MRKSIALLFIALRSIRLLLGPAGVCRFTITCTDYVQEQLSTQPVHKALWNSIRRLCACQPFGSIIKISQE